MKYMMGIDVGTTGCKATVFRQDGEIRAQFYREYPVGQYSGMISPEMVWECVREVICSCTEQYPDIEAICTTSFGESVVAVDGSGRVLCDSVLYQCH